MSSKITIDTSEKFQHLAKAPIVEAVIEVRAKAEKPWDEPKITEQLKAALPDYPNFQSHREFVQEVKLAPGEKAESAVQDLGWKGLRFESADKLHVAQFNRDGFSFSRLKPYESWEQICGEGLRLWHIFMELARPEEIHRLGLRFINRMYLLEGEDHLEDLLQALPQQPEGLDLPVASFFHHETFGVPGYPYAINTRRTIQPPEKPADREVGIILDIDVFTVQPFELKEGLIEKYLAEMRWLKNKVFYGSLNPKAMEKFT